MRSTSREHRGDRAGERNQEKERRAEQEEHTLRKSCDGASAPNSQSRTTAIDESGQRVLLEPALAVRAKRRIIKEGKAASVTARRT
jgi:hypothetical protein